MFKCKLCTLLLPGRTIELAGHIHEIALDGIGLIILAAGE